MTGRLGELWSVPSLKQRQGKIGCTTDSAHKDFKSFLGRNQIIIPIRIIIKVLQVLIQVLPLLLRLLFSLSRSIRLAVWCLASMKRGRGRRGFKLLTENSAAQFLNGSFSFPSDNQNKEEEEEESVLQGRDQLSNKLWHWQILEADDFNHRRRQQQLKLIRSRFREYWRLGAQLQQHTPNPLRTTSQQQVIIMVIIWRIKTRRTSAEIEEISCHFQSRRHTIIEEKRKGK